MHQPSRPQDFTPLFLRLALALSSTHQVGPDGRLYPVLRRCPVCRVAFREDDDVTVGVVELTRRVMGMHDDAPVSVAYVHAPCVNQHGVEAAVRAAFPGLADVREVPAA